MPPRKSKKTKNVKRRRNNRRKTNRKGKVIAVTQMRTQNAFSPKPQVFMKTQLSEFNPVALTYIGAGTFISALGGITVGSMPDFLNISALYNRYKMLAVTYNFNVQPVGTGGLIAFDLPKMTIRYNYDSLLSSTSVMPQVFQGLPNVKTFQFTPDKTQLSYTFYPRCVEPVYLSGLSTGYKLAKQQYIDVGYSNVPHYGIMWYIDSLPTGVKMTLDITYKVAFKYQN